jgi:Na+/H+ antiporter NhaD/arsenite permease-like protein
VTGLLVVVHALGVRLPTDPARGLLGLLLIAGVVGAAAAVANNLPVSAAATALLSAGPAAYAASIGLAVGALATPQGSVATLIATDLAGAEAPAISVRHFAPLAAGALVLATVLLRWTL